MDKIVKTKLLIFTSYLGGGGAEKHLVRLVNQLCLMEFEVVIVTPNKVGQYEQEIHPTVKLIKIGSSRAFRISATLARLTCFFPLLKVIKSERPDLLFSVTDIHNVLTLWAVKLSNFKLPLVLGVQNTPSQAYGNRLHLVQRMIMRSINKDYVRADCIIALSQGVAQDLAQLQPRLRNKTKVIFNIGVDENLATAIVGKEYLKIKPVDKKVIIACGRLTHQKGYPYLIDAFAQVVHAHPQVELWILGEGEEREAIKAKIAQQQLTDSVRLLGFQPNPYVYMAAADLFVLSSLYEGFGNVIVEAMSCGTPVVATDCPHGPAEIIQHQENGWLVPVRDAKLLADAIIKILYNDELQQMLSKNGLVRAKDFSAPLIASQYADHFRQVLKQISIEANAIEQT